MKTVLPQSRGNQEVDAAWKVPTLSCVGRTEICSYLDATSSSRWRFSGPVKPRRRKTESQFAQGSPESSESASGPYTVAMI